MNERTVFIPLRFLDEIRTHLFLNFSDQSDYPVIMGIFGSPGNGKTFQLRATLRDMGVSILSISAADLESDRAGEPGKLVQTTYFKGAIEIASGNPAALVIDDFDTTVGEWDHNTGTVNHQQVIAQIMHLADRPTEIEKIGTVRRVPIFLTGNDFSKLYSPLKRPGRMIALYWAPDAQETEAIVGAILDFLPRDTLTRLVNEYCEAPISFFAEIRIRLIREASARLIKRNGNDMKSVVTDPNRFRQYVAASFDSEVIKPSRVFEVAQQAWDSFEASNTAYLEVRRFQSAP